MIISSLSYAALRLIPTEINYNQVKFVPKCILGTETEPPLFIFGKYESDISSRSTANISYACYHDDGEKVRNQCRCANKDIGTSLCHCM